MVILPAPFVLVMWLIDGYLVVCCARLLFALINTNWARRTSAKLAPIADSVPDAITSAIAQQGKDPVPRWLLWLIVIIVAISIRSTLLAFAFHVR